MEEVWDGESEAEQGALSWYFTDPARLNAFWGRLISPSIAAITRGAFMFSQMTVSCRPSFRPVGVLIAKVFTGIGELKTAERPAELMEEKC